MERAAAGRLLFHQVSVISEVLSVGGAAGGAASAVPQPLLRSVYLRPPAEGSDGKNAEMSFLRAAGLSPRSEELGRVGGARRGVSSTFGGASGGALGIWLG